MNIHKDVSVGFVATRPDNYIIEGINEHLTDFT